MPKKTDLADEGYPVFSGYRVVGYSSRYHYPEPEIIVVARGVGGTGDIKMTPPFCFLTNLSIAIIPETPEVYKPFLYYRLFATTLWKLRTGSAQAQITIERLKDFEVELPPFREQRRIAGILSAYDELIENNRRRVRILEEMARALYRGWFVEFRFPGYEKARSAHATEGDTPSGWVRRCLGEVAEEVRRNVPKGELEEAWPFVGLEHIPRRALALDSWDMVTSLGSNKLEFKRGEILFGKIRPYFHKVSIAPFDGVCSADTIVIRPKRAADFSIVAACVSSDEFVAHASATANGAKMPRANWNVLREFPLVLPPDDVVKPFRELFEACVLHQQALVQQINNLRQTRNLLLPQLLSTRAAIPKANLQ